MPDTPNIKTGRPEQRRKQMPCSDSERCSVWNSSHSCYTVGFFLFFFSVVVSSCLDERGGSRPVVGLDG